MLRSVIVGAGCYLPERLVTNAELAAMVDTSDDWIRSRTGIVTRRYVDPGAFAAPGAPLVTVQDASQLRIRATVSPDAAQSVKRGDRLEAGPICRLGLPEVVAHSFHGTWVSA